LFSCFLPLHLALKTFVSARRVWRCQRGNQNPYIKEEQTTQWPKKKVKKDKQRSTIHTYKTKDRVTRTPLKIGGELRCSGRVGSSCSTSGICRVNLVTNPVLSREWGKDREVFQFCIAHHLASVVIRRKLFQRSSPLKL
jgi:hypothetical protein